MLKLLFDNLISKYGDDFNWFVISDTNNIFYNEALFEINSHHPLYECIVQSVAKCESNDNVLFLLKNHHYAIIHLAYSKTNTKSFPIFEEFDSLQLAVDYIENQFINEYI